MSHDPTDLVGQEELRKESAEDARVRILREQADFRWLMRQPPFRRFMWRVMGEAGMFHDFHSDSVAATNRFLGRRSLGLMLLAEIETLCPQEFDLMRAEVRQKQEMKADGR